MLLKNRPPRINSSALPARPGFDHISPQSLSLLRWLNANKVDYVVIGAVGRAARGEGAAPGPVAIVPAPYRRNLERLTRALMSEHAARRDDRVSSSPDRGHGAPLKLTPEKLADDQRWMLCCDGHELDIERADGRYQELLYEANRFELADGLMVEIASPEDLEHFSHARRTGAAPEFRITRNVAAAPAHSDTTGA